MANREWDVPNTPDTKFRIGSITKQFTAMSVLLLQDQGKLNVQDLICQYIDDCPDTWSGITIHHLLTHTSGIPNFTSFSDYQATSVLPSFPEKTIQRFKDKPLEFQPGEDWNYSNSGYILLGLIVKEASGMSYQGFLKAHIFDPIGMLDTGYDVPTQVIKKRATGYDSGNQIARYIDMTIPYAAGALYSTVGDLYTWITALMNGRVVPQAALDSMWLNSVSMPGTPNLKYGYGLISETNGDRTAFGHNGGINGFVSSLRYFPDDETVIVVLSNMESAGVDTISQAIADILFATD
jgi:CubicO group peptidase (beta-lactamase class C family)